MRTNKKPTAAVATATVLTGLLTMCGAAAIGTLPASAAPSTSVTAAANNPSSTVAAIVQASGNNQNVETGHGFPDWLVVRAIDGVGNGVAGVPVTFTIQPPSGAQTGTAAFPGGAQSITVITDADGYAHNTNASPLTAGRVGDLTIVASTPGVTGTVAFPETVTAPLPMVIFMDGDGQTTAPGKAFAEPVQVLVSDEYGTPLPGW